MLRNDCLGAFELRQHLIGSLRYNDDIAGREIFLQFLCVLRHTDRAADLLLGIALTFDQNPTRYLYLDQVRGSGHAKGYARGQNRQITSGYQTGLLCGSHRAVEQSVRILLLREKQRLYAPVQVQLTAYVIIHTAADDHAARMMLGYHSHRTAGLGDCNNRRRVQVHGCGAGRMGNGVGDIRTIFDAPALETLVIINIRLGTQGNLHHGLQGLYRILAGSSLAGQHNGTGTLVNGVGHVRGLRTGWARILHHGIQHLGGSDNRLTCLKGLADQLLLDTRHLF